MKYKTNWKTSFNIETNTYLLIITSNDNGLNAPIKRQRVANWIKKREKISIIDISGKTHTLK